MTEDVFYSDEAPAISPARAARKEAQSLTEELRGLIHGRSGLDAEGKKAALEAAVAKSQEVTAALTRALEA
jgi:hypothetical protein